VTGGTRRAPRGSLATSRRRLVYAGLFCATFIPAACSTYGEELLQSTQGAGETAGSEAKGGDAAKGGASALGGLGASTSGGNSAGGRAGASAGGEAGAAGAIEGGGGSTSTSGGSGGKSGAGGASQGGAATGGSGGGSAGGGTAGTPGVEMIDDFEDGDLLMLPVHKRNGPWYPFHDATVGGTQTFVNSPLSAANARAGSTAALHMTASGFTDYGAGFGGDFVNMATKKVAYDVSAYKGIRFFAKIATGTQASLKLLIPTTYSDPIGLKCSDTVDGKHCNDHLFCPISGLKTTWDMYECDFADLVQQGFGLPQPTLDPTSVYSVQFTFVTKLLAADVWVDDVMFVLK
jgi:hypothetical protein